MTYSDWAARHPHAAAELQAVFNAMPWPQTPEGGGGRSEAWAQQRQRLIVARAGAMAWRNNVGATPARCPDCGAPRQPIRYGLANDSAQLNAQVKSSDLILAIPRRIGPEHVGRTIAQFGAIESKAPGWRYTGTRREQGQAAWLALVSRLGGFAAFSCGDVQI